MVTGASSCLGGLVVSLLGLLEGVEVAAYGHQELDILDEERLRAVMAEEKPATVINCAGFNDVIAAEHDQAVKLEVNTRGACNLARAATDFHFYLCLFSSKHVFNGKQAEPYGIGDELWPENQYGHSQQAAEEMTANLTKNFLILRRDYLFGFADDGIALIRERLGRGEPLEVAEDYYFAPTYIGDLAAAMVMLAGEWAAGTYHYTNDAGADGVSCYEFARTVAVELGLDADLLQPKPRTEIDFGYPINLPERAILSLDSLREIFPALVRPWRESLREYLAQFGAAK
jgi:dTDP-4-dehydrorhamnose reductase